jgi:acyl-CoA reductase-like NAD-dependent aldehyde dehydrogenase
MLCLEPITGSVMNLEPLFAAQRKAFEANPYPDLATRRGHLAALAAALRAGERELVAAVDADFGGRSPYETRLLELFPLHEAIRHAHRHLRRWMKPERRAVSVWFQPGRARLVKQPLGVVGIIAPWNYPLYLALGPLVAALAAGNRALVKLSEFTPETARVLSQCLAANFPPEQLSVFTGGPEVAQALTALPLDHLLFTGSTAVGRKVMEAAARNLTPVTLELGGKSPAIIGLEYSVEQAAQRILFGKSLNAGQTCIAPDYVLLPEGKEAQFELAARSWLAAHYRELPDNPDYTAVINAQHHERLMRLMDDALALGARVVPLGASNPEKRRIAPTLVFDLSDEMRLMQEEIFGPLLPVVTYRTPDDAIRYVNARPRPLALYLFEDDAAKIERVLHATIAGGVTLNDTILHIAQDTLPFGGVGPSGMGQYHGRAGFDTFSKQKAVFRQARWNALPLLMPPFGKTADRLLKLMLR